MWINLWEGYIHWVVYLTEIVNFHKFKYFFNLLVIIFMFIGPCKGFGMQQWVTTKKLALAYILMHSSIRNALYPRSNTCIMSLLNWSYGNKQNCKYINATLWRIWFNLKWCVLVAQSCLTLCDSMECKPSGSYVHVISQARILEWVPIPLSRGSSWPSSQTWVSWVAYSFSTVWATREAKNMLVQTGRWFYQIKPRKKENIVFLLFNGQSTCGNFV